MKIIKRYQFYTIAKLDIYDNMHGLLGNYGVFDTWYDKKISFSNIINTYYTIEEAKKYVEENE